MNRQTQTALSLLIVLGWAGGAWAAGLADPTEAPPAWLAAQPAAAATKATGEAAGEMQVIVIGRTRKIAVINGEVVKVGDEYRGSKVVAIKANKVVMEDAAKSLDATPGVKKQAPALAKVRKKSVVIPAGSVSSKANRE